MACEELVSSLKERAEATKTGLHDLEAWKEVQVKKLDLMKKAL